jgi:signal transduction histidine kinase
MRTLIQDLERLGIAAALLAPDRRVTSANNRLADLLGSSLHELIDIDIANSLAARSRARTEEGLSTLYQLERDGTMSWFRLDLKPADEGFVALVLDVSRDHQPLRAIRDYQTTRDQLLLDGKIGTWRFDPDADLYHFSSELSLGHDGAGAPVPVQLLQLIQHPDDRANDTAIRERITRHGGVADAEMRYMGADGTWTHLHVHYRSGRQMPSGRFEMFGISQDITAVALARDEANKLSEQLTVALREADYANRTKTEFLANMSHELRTPLNAILGFSEMIECQMLGPVNVRYVAYAHDIHRSGEHLLELVNDVLDLAKLEAGKLEIRETDLSLPDLIEECFVYVQGRADAGRVRLVHEPSVTAGTLRADARAVKQVLLNFLSNAIKFTPEGGRVAVRVFTDADGGLCLSVFDTGIGMTAKEIEVALAPFGQVDSRITRKHKGTGLGLPICKSLMELHGGELLITSEPNVGTTLIASFPRSRVCEPPNPARLDRAV